MNFQKTSEKKALKYLIEKGNAQDLENYLKFNNYTPRGFARLEDKNGRSLLHLAADSGNHNIIKPLIDLGFDINKKDKEGNTPIFYSILLEDGDEIIREFISAGADLNIKDDTGDTALNFAIGFSNNEIISDMLKAGANPNTQNNAGYSPLHDCIIVANSEAIKMLVDAGANPNIKNNEGDTPLNLAINIGTYYVPDLSSDDIAEYMPDFYEQRDALRVEMNKLVKAFLDVGADINIKDSAGNTALDNALRDNNIEAVKLIRAKQNFSERILEERSNTNRDVSRT